MLHPCYVFLDREDTYNQICIPYQLESTAHNLTSPAQPLVQVAPDLLSHLLQELHKARLPPSLIGLLNQQLHMQTVLKAHLCHKHMSYIMRDDCKLIF